MGALDQGVADAILTYQLDLLRLEAGTTSRAIALLNQMVRELTARLRSENLTHFTKARLNALLRQAAATIDEYHAKMQGLLDLSTAGAAEYQVKHIGKTMIGLGILIEPSLPTPTMMSKLVSNLLIQGAPSADWWERQSSNMTWQFAAAVRQGIAQGQTNEQIVARLAQSMPTTRNNIRSLVHTSVQTVANAARSAAFEAFEDVAAGEVWVATLDPHTCIICAARDGRVYSLGDHEPLDGGPPWNGGPGAIHWGCRCVASIKLRDIPGMPKVPVGTRASSRGPVKGNTDFAEYLDRMGTQFQNDVLGPGRADLWRRGKLTLEQLLDLSGNPMSLAELKATYG